MSDRTRPRKVKASNKQHCYQADVQNYYTRQVHNFNISSLFFSTPMKCLKWQYKRENKQKHTQWITLAIRIKGIHHSVTSKLSICCITVNFKKRYSCIILALFFFLHSSHCVWWILSMSRTDLLVLMFNKTIQTEKERKRKEAKIKPTYTEAAFLQV